MAKSAYHFWEGRRKKGWRTASKLSSENSKCQLPPSRAVRWHICW